MAKRSRTDGWKRRAGCLALALGLSALAAPCVWAEDIAPPLTANAAAAPWDLESAVRHAQLLRKAGDLSGATKVLSQLVLAAPDDPRVLGEYGKTLVTEGRADDALAFLQRAVELQPNDWMLYSAEGVAFDQKADYASAQIAYDKALHLKADDATILSNAGLSRMQAGDLDGAERYLLQAVPGGKDYPRIAQNLAMVQALKAMRAVPLAPQPAPQAAPPAEPAVILPPPAKAEIAPLPPPVPLAVVMQPVPKDDKAGPVATHAKAATKPASKQASARSRALYVQAGAFASAESAQRVAGTLQSLGARVSPGKSGGQPVYRVRIGPFLDADQASAAIEQAHVLGQANVKIVSE